jgi:hypothetical protein
MGNLVVFAIGVLAMVGSFMVGQGGAEQLAVEPPVLALMSAVLLGSGLVGERLAAARHEASRPSLKEAA